jgi:hypothetical protein
MSIEPCQICGGTGFMLRPLPIPPGWVSPPGVIPPAPRPYDPNEGPVPANMESVVCESCSGSGVSAGL